ncbi:MAG: glycosyltransferase [Candidatus Levybacteria bacterium]|nr:glycosyltransferase [Candidatus Levybacteria bacterium]
MKVSFIATVYNEEASIKALLDSLMKQSQMPAEIIISDGGSTDRTVGIIKAYPGKIKIIIKKGNRSVGRNEAIRKTTNEIIVCSDSGCILDKNWVKNIIEPFSDPKTDVVAGYYVGKPNSVFEKCLIPYVLVMPDKIDANSFLPASRSMAFRKSTWKNAGKFPKEFNNNEDYVFAKNLMKINAKIVFEKKAIVYWRPRSNIKNAFTMFYRFAKGDSESRIFRPKVILIFARYIAFLIFTVSFLIFKSYIILNTLYLILAFYILWSIAKNYKYVKDARAIVFLPLIQFVSDTAVIAGTVIGLLTQKLKILIEGLFYITIVYSIILLNFRHLRSLFSPPKINQSEIVGYAQYFGYPLYFETIILFIFIFTPILVFFVLSKMKKI